LTSNGQRLFLDCHFEPVRDSRGKVTGVGIAAVNLTEQKQAEEALAAAHRQTQSIIDNTPAIVYAFDLEERFIMANAALGDVLKCKPRHMLGKRRHELMPQADADRQTIDW
jgi:PAS domain-containing protein